MFPSDLFPTTFASSADSAGEWANIALTFEIFGAGTPRRQVRAAEQLMKESFDEWPTALLVRRAAARPRVSCLTRPPCVAW